MLKQQTINKLTGLKNFVDKSPSMLDFNEKANELHSLISQFESALFEELGKEQEDVSMKIKAAVSDLLYAQKISILNKVQYNAEYLKRF